MGSCLCREEEGGAEQASRSSQTSDRLAQPEEPPPQDLELPDPDEMKALITDILHYTGSPHELTREPAPLSRLHQVADTEEGWCFVVIELTKHIGIYEPLGASTINVVFEVCPLPAHDTVLGFTLSLHLSKAAAKEAYLNHENMRYARNILIVLDCIGEKFGGVNCTDILNNDMLEYMVEFLIDVRSPHLVLHAIITLEKMSDSASNKKKINDALARCLLHPLLPLELHADDDNYEWRQVGFCARWALDNTFLFPDRPLSYEHVDMGDTRVILNVHDMSSYLKVGPDGLEARCDAHSFESVRATHMITDGVWYYEAEIMTAGVMQIGWAAKNTPFQSHDGYGVGDDAFSIGYDGCRRLIWHKAQPQLLDEDVPPWLPGDIVGCLIDVIRSEAIFSLNGFRLPKYRNIFFGTGFKRIEMSIDDSSEGLYAAATFMAHQQCRFNFGTQQFRYPPTDRHYQVMNDFGFLSADQQKIIPRHLELEQLNLEVPPTEARCVVCLSDRSRFGINPCKHRGFCQGCATLLTECPLCRRPVYNYFSLHA